MRQISFFLLLTFILLLRCNENEKNLTSCVGTKPEKKKDCTDHKISGNMNCCYVKYKLGNTKYEVCSAIVDTEKEIKEYKDMLKDASGVDIQCKSSFATFSLWVIVLVIGIITN